MEACFLVIKILFVCHGNICRSPMAEFVMKHLVKQSGLEEEFEIDSAATSTEEIGNDIYPPAKRKLTEKGVPFTRRAARQMRRADYDRYDLLICMDDYNIRNMMRILGSDPEHKVSTLLSRPVADPWYIGDFDSTYDDILEGCTALLERLK